ncbi:MAG: hypothetical protein IJ191_08460, partial [Treponema sp.]|nr:hypothetical protein [Treponema sp.]
WTDTVTDYRTYYYAVIATTRNGRYEILLPAINTTVRGTALTIARGGAAADTSTQKQEKLYPAGTLREMPLPALDIIENMNQQPTVSAQSRAAAIDLLPHSPPEPAPPLTPYIFEVDYFSPDGGDDYLLFDTLRKTFAQQDYAAAVTQLETLTGTNLAAPVITRGMFYLGQSYYFTGNYRNAIRCFLATRDQYPALSKQWIDSSLGYIALP